MSINFTYEIASVDEQARVMEVVYRSDGKQEMRISARLPYDGESLDDVIQSFSPVPLWKESELTVSAPVVGATGSLAEPIPQAEVRDNEDMRASAYKNESDPLFFKWQRGETTEQAWLDKVAEIKAKYPEGGTTTMPTPASGNMAVSEL